MVIIATLIVIAIKATPFIIFYQLGEIQQEKYNDSFYINHKVKEYNHPKIMLYNSELIKYTKEAIDSVDIYSKFKADTKKELAINCIYYFVDQYESSFSDFSSYRTNARNLYANTENKIEKAKKHARFINENRHTFASSIVISATDDITEPASKTEPSICNNVKSVDELYKIFIPVYLNAYIPGHIKQPPSYLEPLKKQIEDWFNILKLEHPLYFDHAAKEEAFKKELDAKALAEENRIKEKRRLQKIEDDQTGYYQAIQDNKIPILAAIWYHQNIELDILIADGADLNIKDRFGRTPLFIAVQKENAYALDLLLKQGANMQILDQHDLYTPFTQLISSSNPDMEMVQIFLDHDVDLNFTNKYDFPTLVFAVQGCTKLDLVQLLIDKGARLKDIDTTLASHCPDRNNHKLRKLLENQKRFFFF